MTDNIARTHPDESLADEARQWLTLLYVGSPTHIDRLRFEAWLNRSDDHRQAFLQAEEAWSMLGGCVRVEEWVAEPVTARMPRGRSVRRIWPALVGAAAVAASVLIVIGPSRIDQASQTAPARYTTGIGQLKTVELDDGTILTLGAASSVEVTYTREVRSIDLLRGSAYFDVAHDSARPMMVDAASNEIRVLGTAFGIRIGPKDVSVEVARGRISVGIDISDDSARHSTLVTLPAGRAVVADLQGRVQDVRDADLGNSLGWVEGQLVYDDVPLSEVVADINRYRAKRLEIVTPRLEALRVTSSFPATGSDRFIAGLPAAYGVRVRELPDRTVVME